MFLLPRGGQAVFPSPNELPRKDGAQLAESRARASQRQAGRESKKQSQAPGLRGGLHWTWGRRARPHSRDGTRGWEALVGDAARAWGAAPGRALAQHLEAPGSLSSTSGG